MTISLIRKRGSSIEQGVNVVPLRRVDSDETKSPLEDELDNVLSLPDDVGVHCGLHQRTQAVAPGPGPPKVVARDFVEGHSVTTSPGFQSGLRSQYS